MRGLQLNWVLFASFMIIVTTNAASTRHKRTLSLVKNFIHSAIFGSENKTVPASSLTNNEETYKIFRIPGFDHVLVKAVPKVTEAVPEKVLTPVDIEDQKVGVIASYLGTQSQAETLNALEGVKALLGSGILTANKDVIDAVPIGPLPPYLQLVAIEDGTVEKPIFDTSNLCDEHQVHQAPIIVQQPAFFEGHPLLTIFHRPITYPSVLKPVGPVKVPIPILPTKYSYKQIHGDGRVTTYTSHDNHNVVVTESRRPVPLPPFLNYRIQEVMKMGAQGMQGTLPVFASPIQTPIELPKFYPYPPVESPSNYLYKQVHKDGTATSYSSSNKGENVVVSQTVKVPPLPLFITDRIEKVAATAVTGNQPNIGVLSGSSSQTYWYPPLYDYPKKDIRGGVQVKVDNKEQQKMDVGSQSTYSYQTLHNDGTVTNHYVGTEKSAYVGNAEAKPISPEFIEDRLQTIAKTSGGSFSYKILHKDGSVTNYGNGNGERIVMGNTANIVENHYGNSVDSKLNIIQKNTNNNPQHVIPSSGGFSYKAIHNDGSVTLYSQKGVEEINNPTKQTVGHYINVESVNPKATESKNTQHIKDNLSIKDETADVISQTDANPGSFSYKAIHNDGSMTIYSQNGVEEIHGQHKQVDRQHYKTMNSFEANEKSNNQNTQVHLSNIDDTVSNKQPFEHNIYVSSQTNVNQLPGSFSYKAVHNDGSMTIYSQNGVKKENIDLKGKNEQRILPSVTIDQSKRNGIVSSGSFSYKTIHSDGSKNNFSDQGADLAQVTNSNGALNTQIENIVHPKIHINQQDKAKPSGSFSYKTVHSDGSVHSIESESFQQNTQTQDQGSTARDEANLNYENTHTIKVIPPAPELPETSSDVLTVTPASVLVADPNKVLFAKPVVSSYSYQQINHNQPNQFTVAVNIDEASSKDSQLKVSSTVAASGQSSKAALVDTNSKDYVYVPPANTNEPLPIKPTIPQVKHERTHNIPSAVVLTPVDTVPCVEKSLSQNPIVVLDEPIQYSYEHRKADGSAMIVKNDQNVVSVNISSEKEQVKNRGDIP